MAERSYACIVCGRKFPEGQGIVLSRGGVTLHFHSSRCAAKFLRRLIENSSDSCIAESLKETLEAFTRALDARKKAAGKVI